MIVHFHGDRSRTMTSDSGEPKAGDSASAESLHASRILPLVYEQLRAIAKQRLSLERRDHTLQATALVHEAYLRLSKQPGIEFENRAHFYAAAAEAMRRILVEHARSLGREKRSGSRRRTEMPLDVVDLAAAVDSEEILTLEAAIRRLEKEDASAAKVVQLRFYAGLSVDETAEALGISASTVDREWAFARAWLRRAIDSP
jgi:RNA polymerase sigma factor (TIGR02999 family)